MCSEPHSIVDLSEWGRGNLFKYYIDHTQVVRNPIGLTLIRKFNT